MMDIFTLGAEEKQDKRISRDIALQLGKILEIEEHQKESVDAINKSLTKLAKRDESFANSIISELGRLYPEINKRFEFKLNLELA
jgi:hypothetical protein